jgi:hypothetical protein
MNTNTNSASVHNHVIEQLADEVDHPVTTVKALYEDILAQMQDRATIHDYLPILVSKRVKHILKVGFAH